MRHLLAVALLLSPVVAFAQDDQHEEEHHDHEHEEAHAADDAHDHQEDHAHDDDGHVSELGDLRVLHAWSRATSGPDALVFMSIDNDGEQIAVLSGAEAEMADSASLVGAPINAGGDPLPLEMLEVAGGTMFDMRPDTVYILLEGIDGPFAEGDAFEVELEFEELGHLHVNVDVEAENAQQHSHAGHMHE
ncbi:copper chaperone PCu(A)C [Pelagovum pacificum]|uniref:Copper chaperone PCu(A)C n=1 Tax=Pelagovum pacificum TaxID=2588711 RepID=A0A5C5GBW3_9RHOB|nr:copper chaperone PCu(A)C [Pelagovum pacificum]QQA42513.1 copper chaperone PCu(A)C [Pelagovum pacificum]TNY31597.1 copper chaperone PCu(A)C [Pelagovum pacificum]